MKTMGEMIANRRKELGMTQAALADKMNVTDKAVSKWERNLACPDLNSIPKLAEILEVSIDELLNAKKSEARNSEPAAIVGLILKAVPLAMGVATVVLSILKKLDSDSAFVMLGIGLACLAIGALQERTKQDS